MFFDNILHLKIETWTNAHELGFVVLTVNIIIKDTASIKEPEKVMEHIEVDNNKETQKYNK